MIRHGSYSSVYSGLSSVSVTKGQKVSTREPLGKVGKNADGKYVLHFQLRNGSTGLNPELWVK
jgi:septal ring factor EnvC (AmiA/AmiB activator)